MNYVVSSVAGSLTILPPSSSSPSAVRVVRGFLQFGSASHLQNTVQPMVLRLLTPTVNELTNYIWCVFCSMGNREGCENWALFSLMCLKSIVKGV